MRLQASFLEEKTEVAHEHEFLLLCAEEQKSILRRLRDMFWNGHKITINLLHKAPLEIRKGKIVSVFLEGEGGITYCPFVC